MLVHAVMNLIFKILWKLILDKKKSIYWHKLIPSNIYTMATKKKRKLQMCAGDQIKLEVLNTAKPIVLASDQDNVLSLSKQIVAMAVK